MLCVLHRFYKQENDANEKTYENLLKGLNFFHNRYNSKVRK